MKIALIGAGNVAWHLAQAFEEAGHQVSDVWSRNKAHAQQLARKLYAAKVYNEPNFDESDADLFVIAIADNALETVIEQLILPENALLVHTSGTQSLATLRQWLDTHSDVPVQAGVFYPLQTFSKQVVVNIAEVPICIEAEDADNQEFLVELAQDISNVVYLVNSKERKILHVAAVFACNFVNHLWAISQDLLQENDLDFDLLKPLIKETLRKAMDVQDIHQVQTGPARRGDQQVIQEHLKFLQKSPHLRDIYKILTEHIREACS